MQPVDYAILILLAVSAAAVLLHLIRRRRRMPGNKCMNCGSCMDCAKRCRDSHTGKSQ